MTFRAKANNAEAGASGGILRGRKPSGRHSPSAAAPTVLLFGDSHSDAIQRAVARRLTKGGVAPLKVHRLLKKHWKSGVVVGDTTLEDFLGIIGGLRASDIVLSMVGGNQHAVFSTIQHPVPFDFLEPGAEAVIAPAVEIIPHRVVASFFADWLKKGDGRSIEAIRNATKARVIHVIPPPPKADNAFINAHHETVFAREGISAQGVSPPALRMRFWRLQTRLLAKFCKSIGVEVLMPPGRTLDEEGFLGKDFYAKDATHANSAYGEFVLREVDKLVRRATKVQRSK
jgi:hypothetical protein